MIVKTARGWYLVAIALAWTAGYLIGPSAAEASHTTITSQDSTFSASPFNGYRVYLSSPTHTNSGGRGEIGWEENINGRHWNYYAAQGNYVNEVWSSWSGRNIIARGFHATVSENSRNAQFMAHVDRANAWGADVYVTTHTNCCGGEYLLIMRDDSTSTSLDRKLQEDLYYYVGDYVAASGRLGVPGNNAPIADSIDDSPYTSGRDLGELGSANDAPYNVYSELIFHTSRTQVNWFGSGSNWKEVTNSTWRYGAGIDRALGWP